MKPILYKDLEIFMLGKELAVKVHKLTLKELPKFEMYEEGSQIRRLSKSIISNYCRRMVPSYSIQYGNFIINT